VSGELATRELGDIVAQLSLDIPEEPERVDELAGAVTTLTNGGDWAVAAMVSARTEEGKPGRPKNGATLQRFHSYRSYADLGIRGLSDPRTVKFYAEAWEAKFPKPTLGETVPLPDEPFPRRTISVHHSSEESTWETPQDLFDELDAEFKFELDVCAEDETAKCPTYFTPNDDGLTQDWGGFVCWMNPPYGAVIDQWVRKAFHAAKQGATVVCLLPARVDTGWWFDYCRWGEIRFIKGRLRFGDADASAPFPSAVVVFGRSPKPSVSWWER